MCLTVVIEEVKPRYKRCSKRSCIVTACATKCKQGWLRLMKKPRFEVVTLDFFANTKRWLALRLGC